MFLKVQTEEGKLKIAGGANWACNMLQHNNWCISSDMVVFSPLWGWKNELVHVVSDIIFEIMSKKLCILYIHNCPMAEMA